MAKSYFRTISTIGPNEPSVIIREHDEKLANYLRYGYPASHVVVQDMAGKGRVKELDYEIEIKQMSTTSAVKNHDYVLVTVLCCEDKPKEGEKSDKY